MLFVHVQVIDKIFVGGFHKLNFAQTDDLCFIATAIKQNYRNTPWGNDTV